MIKKIMALIMACFAVFAFAGCGKDISGTYVGESIAKDEPVTYVMKVTKDKSKGYDVKLYQASYKLKPYVVNKDTAIIRSFNAFNMWNEDMYKEIPDDRLPQVAVKADFQYDEYLSFIMSDLNDQNVMTEVGAKGIDKPKALKLDKDGNLIDIHTAMSSGDYLTTKDRKFVKAKDFKLDTVKEELQKRIEAICKAKYDKPHNSKFAKMEFEDNTTKK